MATRVGTFLDRYEIDAEIGRGAMGAVYRARDPKLDRTVAIKTVSLFGLEPDAEQEYRERFVVEARAAGRLSHGGIVTIFDVREEGETRAPYLVMEYIEGQSLQKLLSRENRTLPLSTTLYLIQEVAEALHYAHAQGVVHRDIKPANILIDADGHAKIADFGIAKLNQTDLTLPGQVLGSPAYMAPEQLSDEGVDARSDLFSLGVILYQMLTGHRPFQGNSTTTVCFKLVNHEPLPVSAFESKLPPELDTIVSRAIAKDPAQRYQSGMEMAADIQRFRETSGFVNRQIDWTARSLKRTTTNRHITDLAERGSAERADSVPATTCLITDSTLAHKENNATQSRGSWFPSTNGLAYALLAAAMGLATFFSLQHTKPELSGPKKMEPAVQQSSTSIHDDSRNKDRTTMKIPMLRANVSRPRAKVPVPPANIPVAAVPASATLLIEIDHHFIDARASVWLDNDLVYAHSLRGDSKRRALVFRKVEGHQFEAVRVPAGKHDVRVRIQSAADSYDQSKTIADASIGSSESMLRIVCGKKPGQLQLILE
jgi:serine/threonine protein kinase